MRLRPLVPGLGEFAVEPDRLVEIADRRLVALHPGAKNAAQVMRQRIGAIERDHLVVVADGALVLVLAEPRLAAPAPGIGEPGVEPDRLAEIGDRFVVVALPVMRDTAI